MNILKKQVLELSCVLMMKIQKKLLLNKVTFKKDLKSQLTLLNKKYIIKDIKSSKISFPDAAGKHSSCASGPRHGGELGWFEEEKMHPDFSNAVKVIPVDDIGPPVITPWGVHIVYRQG